MPRDVIWPPGEPPPPPSGGVVELISNDPPIWIYAIDIPSSPRTKLRLTAYPETVYFGRDSTGAAVAYSPASIGQDRIQVDSEGGSPTVRLFIQNVTREAIALFEEYHGLSGERVRASCVLLSQMPDGNPELDDIYEIMDSTATDASIEVTLGRAALRDMTFPSRRISRLYCQHRYGSVGCGYDITRAGALPTCSKLEEGPNGCVAHGQDEADNSLEVRHPNRILLFKGVARQSGIGVS